MPPALHTATEAAPETGRSSDRREALDEQKRSFLRMVSHELRTPLNSILGFSEILAAELYGPLGAPQYKEYAEIIRGSGNKLLKLVNQVLEIARLDGDAADLKPRPEPIVPAIEDVLKTLEAEREQRDLPVSLAEVEELCVLADPRGLRTVLSNLLQNAIAFSPQGGEIRLSAARNGELVEIVVANDGDGVDPAELARLVRPFEQGENALTRHSEGAGLGLPICDLTCKAMGGLLKLVSAPGQGFSAHVILRAA